MLKNPHGDGGAGRYILLAAEEEALLGLMDGERSVQAILVEQLSNGGGFALDRLGRLTAMLAANGFFGEERPNIFRHLQLRQALRRPITRVQLLLRRAVMWHIASWSNVQGPIDVAYRAGFRVLFTPPGAIALGVLILAGLVTWARELATPRHQLFTIDGSYALGLLSYIAMQVIGMSLHELGHALAIRHYRRHVRRLGVGIYYLMPFAYVDSTDMVMTGRAPRIAVSAAGAVAGFALAALAAFVAAAEPAGSLAGSLALKAASLLVFQNAMQLLPILELDGYHILVDILDSPLLRQRAMSYARTRLVRRLRTPRKMTKEEIGLAVYGVAAIATSLGTLAFGIWIWQARVHVLARELWDSGPFARVALAAILVIFLGPLLLAVASQVLGWTRAALDVARRRRLARRRLELVERARLLARTAFFRDLRPAELTALATHLVEERAEPGATIVREGDEGDRFFVVVEGEADVLIGPDETKVRELRTGDPFGEIALLERVPRTATVRANTPMRLYALDRAHFHRWAGERLAVTARARASLAERERIGAMPLFSHLSSGELDRLLARLRLRGVPAGTDAVQQGEPGDLFYVVSRGRFEVLVDGRRIRELGPGEFFGELALLTRRPRSATVRAVEDSELYALAPADLGDLLRASADAATAVLGRKTAYGNGSAVVAATGG